jgi:hypothetical protein
LLINSKNNYSNLVAKHIAHKALRGFYPKKWRAFAFAFLLKLPTHMKWILLFWLVVLNVFSVWGQQIKAPKLTPALQHYITTVADAGPDSADLVLSWQEGKGAMPQQWRLLEQYGHSLKTVRVPKKMLAQLAAEPRVLFAGLAQKPIEELTTGSLDITLNKLNAAHALMPEITGAGQRLVIKEQRFDTGDIDYRNRVFATGLEGTGASTHAALMATIAAGAGNTSEEAVGAAPGALVGATSFENLLPGPDTLVLAKNMFIHNHSYGTVVENYYGLEALAYDEQVYRVPQVMHVFSAGNSGLSAGSGPYENGTGWANLTGNFKYAKNILTVGAIDSFAKVAPQSSKGPAWDGRVKPELTAFGEDGSSGAAALVSGTAALLQQAYREQTGFLPSAALLKAILIGSAFDVGAAGVDYSSGWGALDGLSALRMIKNKSYATLQLTGQTQKTTEVEVPAGISRLKVTISWTDGPAAVNAAKALVNNIDLLVQHPASGREWLPWVLHPHPDSLNKPAKRSRDTLNNTEQVWIDDPQPGLYRFIVTATPMVRTAQEVAVTWQMDTSSTFLFTYPAGNGRLEAGRNQLVRWQTFMQGQGTLQVAYDGGNWQTIGAPNLSQQYMYWAAPDTNAAMRFRMLLPGGAMAASERFVISRPIRLDVGFRCADSLMLTWSGRQQRAFDLYVLSGTSMMPVLNIADSFAIVRTPPGAVPIYSIAPVVAGLRGRRSFALNTDASGVGCYFKSFYVQGQDARSVDLRVELGTVYNLSAVRLQKKQGTSYVDLPGHTSSQLTAFFKDSSLVSGYNFYRVVALLANGQEIIGDLLAVFHFGGVPVAAFPNPVKRGAALNLQSELPGRYFVWVYDINGRLLRRQQLQDVSNSMIVEWPAGLYLLRIGTSNEVLGTTKIIVY